MTESISKAKLRIVQDYQDFIKNKPDDIFFYINKSDIFNNKALIIGPKNTPYFGGYYLFDVTFKEDYPNSSPILKLLTIDGTSRLNPNLYECGKVCLSILGTWSGPSWKPVMTIRTVLSSIQSLLSEYPIHNEPGFEETDINDEKNIQYSRYIIYHNYNLAIIEILKNVFNLKPTVKIKDVIYFKDIIIETFKKNYEALNDDLKCYQITIGETIISKVIYFLRKEHHLDFLDLNSKFDNIVKKKKLSK